MKNVSDGDKYWLLERKPDASQAQIEAFLENVAVVWCDSGLFDEQLAREVAYQGVFGGIT